MLKFIYGTMNSSKSLNLLAVAHNYESLQRKIELFKPTIDTRSSQIETRAGLFHSCRNIDSDFDFVKWFLREYYSYNKKLDAILIDESQFLTEEQVIQLGRLSDSYNVDIFCYGLKNDYTGHLFLGSKALLENSDKIEENRTLCKYCNQKATHNLLKINGKVIDDYLESGNVFCGDEEYESVCRNHFYEIINK